MPLNNHPLRARVVSEMHMRRMPALQAPCQMVQVIRIIDPADHGRERSHAMTMPGVPRPQAQASARHIAGLAPGGVEFAWERHSEATTATVIFPRQSASDVFAERPGDEAAMAWIADAPGGVLRAVRVGIVPDEESAEAVVQAVGFSQADLVSCRIGPARIWSDFLLHGDGYGRLLVAANGTRPEDLGRLVQKLQELGNYRNMALLGLPMAQEKAREVAEAEAEIVSITERMAQGQGDRSLLDQLTALAAKVSSLTAATAFRMSATAAYTSIATDRLAQLPETPVEGFITLEEFTERRLLPAARTCESFVRRLETLSVRIERATSLLRTRVEMTVEEQNVALLQSMNRTAARQVRLQKLVEGLSVMAVSYYAVGLLLYLFKGVAPMLGGKAELWTGLAVLPVFLVVWLYLRARVRKIEAGDEPQDG